MGRYLNFCSSSVNSTFKSYCKIKYLMSILRKRPQLTEIYSPELLKCPHQHSRFTRKLLWQSGHTPYLNKTGSAFHLNAGEVKVFAHFYCTSAGRDGFKAEAPVGLLEATQDSHLSRLGGRIGQSFKLLSTHINLYFKSKHFAHPAKNATFETVQRRTRAPRPIRRVTKERHMTQNTKPTIQLSKDKETNPLQENSSVELFHISSLARFGESYNYVAKHINSVFSRGGAKSEEQDHLDKQSISEPNRIENNLYIDETFLPNTRADQQRAKVQTQTSNSWEDGYALFAAHINSYFGASVTDEEKFRENNKLQQSFKPIKPTRPQTFEYKDGAQGLFHSSNNATHFGESYFQMAHHINQYFQSEAVAEHDLDEDLTEVDRAPANSGKTKTVSLMDCLLHPSSVPDFVNSYLRPTQTAPGMASPRTRRTTKYLNIKQAEEATHNLIATLGQTSAPDVLTSSVEALNEHLIRYPSCRMILWQEKTAVLLLKKRRTYRNHEGVQNAIREMLALVGYVDAVKGRGIRVLSIDGGGTRGVVPLQVLKVLEAQTGKKIHQLFDYICGVSTGKHNSNVCFVFILNRTLNQTGFQNK
uniref:PNPLA domain-containing protein n=1 Tax=Neogobius melanostomus TaxID=47308 RepID=A0A8C6UTZ2_9GOBI